VLVVGGGIVGRTETATLYIYRALDERQYYGAIPFRSWRMIGRDGLRRATVLNPRRLNVEAVPVKTLEVLPG